MRKTKNYLIITLSLLFAAISVAMIMTLYRQPTTPEEVSSITSIESIEDTTYVETTSVEVEVEETTGTVPAETTVPTEEKPTEKNPNTTKTHSSDSLLCDTTDEIEMLACVIYQEAGSDSICDECRYRVADVVLNRIENGYWGDTMLEVLTARKQYGRYYWTGVKWKERSTKASEAKAVARAYAVAEDILINGNHSDLYGKGYIWQAEFKQGKSYFKCCGTYFGKS